ncbi:MAG TPA: hypothetical protein VGC35_12470 [Allosphingosinicella sp.]|jgi:hypothetical protein
MAEDRTPKREGKSAALRLAEEVQRRPIAAALVGSAAAAGAYMGARAIARRAADGKPINQVLKTAITASECAKASKNGKGGKNSA